MRRSAKCEVLGTSEIVRSAHRSFLAVAVTAVFAFGASPASAILSFDLDTGNSAISGYTGPYATVTVNRTSATTADITFTALDNGSQQFFLIDGSSGAVNVNATTFTVGSIAGTNSFPEPATGFDPWSLAGTGSGNVNGFGSFNLTIDSFDAFKHAIDELTFTLTNTSGTWATDGDVLTANSNGALAAAHIAVTDIPVAQANGALATGFAAGSGGSIPPSEIPEPATLALIGMGLAGLAAARRKAA